ncbi:MAG: UDP-N-acetylmuramate dehydrogenase [Lawsonibacter sp.]|jgi:UDP-N-acetylmuramate dehydrogenase|nr:UDP-N-acetylmuramate dehydrogenase [Lawsonibacter sp.]
MERLAELKKRLEEGCPGLELREDEPMSRHTTFRIGGPAALMALPRTVGEAKAAVKAARALEVEPFFLGNGSNLLAADGGYPGFVVKLAGDFDQIREVNRGLEAGSAVLLSRLSNALLGRGLTGLEFAGGIPGSVGGAVTMNAGAYGGEVAQVLESATFLDESGEVRTLPAPECGFGYRKSIFSDRKCLILKARFHLEQGGPAAIKARMEELAAKRREKQPLEYPSAGSMFKRPPGHFAAALIDQCGLKGLAVGGAQVSEKHAGFVVNRGGATCADVLELVRQVKEEVLRQTGVELEMEVKVLK